MVRVGEVEWLYMVFLDDFFVLHPGQHFDSGLDHTGQYFIGSEFVDEFLGVFPFLLYFDGFLVVIESVIHEGLFISIVITFVVGESLIFEEYGFLDDMVEELSIMTDYDNSVIRSD